MELKIRFTSTGEDVKLTFTKAPKLSDIFKYKDSYYMVADYDGEFVHVVKVNKHEVKEISFG